MSRNPQVSNVPYPKRAHSAWKVLPKVAASDLEGVLNELERTGWTINGAHMERGDGDTFVVTATCYVNDDGFDHNRTGTAEQYRAVIDASRDFTRPDAERALLYDASVSFWYHLPPSEQERARKLQTESEIPGPHGEPRT